MLPTHTLEERSKSLDLMGALLATSGLMLLVYTLSHGNTWGWLTLQTLSFMCASIVLMLAFLYNESRVAHHLMPLKFFRIGNVAAALAVQLPITASMFSMFFFLSIYLQSVLSYSPLQTGLAFLPVSLIIGISATQAPRLIRRVGYKPILTVAPLFIGTGLLSFVFTSTTSTYWDILPGLLIIPIGLGFSFVSVTIAATSGVPGHESGLASGLLTTAQQIGGSLGLAILSGIAASATTATSLSSSVNDSRASLVDGFHAAYLGGAVFALVATCVAFFFLKPIAAAAHEPTPALH